MEFRVRVRVVIGREEEEGGVEGLRVWVVCWWMEVEGYYVNSVSIVWGKYLLNVCFFFLYLFYSVGLLDLDCLGSEVEVGYGFVCKFIML